MIKTRDELIQATSLKDVENVEKQLNYFSKKYPHIPSFCIQDPKDRSEKEECEKSWAKIVEALSDCNNEEFDKSIKNLKIDDDMQEVTDWMLEDCHN